MNDANDNNGLGLNSIENSVRETMDQRSPHVSVQNS